MDTTDPAASGRIFISYRREETAYPAGWLYDRLDHQFGGGQVFKDVDSIQLGDDFVDAITRAVGSCDVLLALIGDHWLTITDERNKRRLDDPDDFVRLEIEAALARNVRVIPVLVDGARMPRADELPSSLVTLTRRQALELSPSRFESDTNRLIKVLEWTLAEVRTGQTGDPPTAQPDPTPNGSLSSSTEPVVNERTTEVASLGASSATPPITPVGPPADSGPVGASGRGDSTGRGGVGKGLIIAAAALAAAVILLIAALLVTRNGGDGDDASPRETGIELPTSFDPSPVGLELTDLDFQVRNDPPFVGDTFTLTYTLKNTTDEDLQLDDTFVGVRNPANVRDDAENVNEGKVLRPGESVDASGSVPLKEAGLWKVFPCYTLPADTYCPDLWNVVFVPVSEG